MMTLSAENVIRQQWVENSVEIYLREIEKVLLHIAGYRIDGIRLRCHGVDEGRHAHLQHFEERIAHWEPLGSSEHRVFQDVRNSGVIGRRGRKRNGETILVIGWSEKVQYPRAGLSVCCSNCHRTQFRKWSDLINMKTVNRLSNAQVVLRLLLLFFSCLLQFFDETNSGFDGIQYEPIAKLTNSFLCTLCVLISAFSAVKALNPNRKDRKVKTQSS